MSLDDDRRYARQRIAFWGRELRISAAMSIGSGALTLLTLLVGLASWLCVVCGLGFGLWLGELRHDRLMLGLYVGFLRSLDEEELDDA